MLSADSGNGGDIAKYGSDLASPYIKTTKILVSTTMQSNTSLSISDIDAVAASARLSG